MWCPGVLPSVKLHALHRSVVSVGVTVLLGLCNPPRRGCGEPAKLGLLYPLVWIPCCGIIFAGVAKKSRLLNK
jgi:cytochrome c biogenesis protein CcdA